MSLILNGTDGLSDVDGSASTPAIRGTDANTGIFFPAADTIAFAEGGAEVMRIASDGKVGIGTSSPGRELHVNGNIRFASNGVIEAGGAGGLNTYIAGVEGGSGYWALAVNGAEQARLTVGGNLQFNSGYGSVATAYGCRAWVNFNGTGTVAIRASGNVSSITDNGTGDYTVNFTTAMPDANYSMAGVAGAQTSGTNPAPWSESSSTARTASACRVYSYWVTNGLQDQTQASLAFFR
jgi:hypothetical protein